MNVPADGSHPCLVPQAVRKSNRFRAFHFLLRNSLFSRSRNLAPKILWVSAVVGFTAVTIIEIINMMSLMPRGKANLEEEPL